MSQEVDELLRKCVELRDAGRLDEAILAARRATGIAPESANSWWQLALAVADKEGDAAALDYFRKTVEIADSFGFGWDRLGAAYESLSMLDDAIEAWETACFYDEDLEWSRYSLIAAYRKRGQAEDKEKIFEQLSELETRGKLRESDHYLLAVAHSNKEAYRAAIIHFKRCLALLHEKYGYTNLGSEYASAQESYANFHLAYAFHKVGQDLDAADRCHMALSEESAYYVKLKATDLLTDIKPKLQQITFNVRKNPDSNQLISESTWFENYINPFELLRIESSDAVKGAEVKEVQKSKKILLQEIDLEDGFISWMPNLKIDRSRAIKLVDEILDEHLRYYHQQVYQCKPLLDFLSRGQLDLFLYDGDEVQTAFLSSIMEDEGFAEWISDFFAKQYDSLFAVALSSRNISVIEAMLSGRRFVAPEYDDKCFAKSIRSSHDLLIGLKAELAKVDKTKPTIEAIRRVMTKQSLGRILEVLPPPFQEAQSSAAQMIRSIAVRINNHHDDADLAKQVLKLAENFARKSPSFRVEMEQDLAKLDELIAEEKKYESHLIFGDNAFRITRDGVVYGEKAIKTVDTETLRWGVVITNSSDQKKIYDFRVVVGGKGSNTINVSWKSSSDIKKQNELFEKCVNAIFTYIFPTVLEKVQSTISDGRTVYIGGIPITQNGLTLKARGWFSTKDELCSWGSVTSEVSNGSAVITSLINPKATASLALADVDNAWILHMLIKEGMMK